MPLVSMRQLLDHAAENGYGIPAFNVNNLEQVQAVMSAAQEAGAPVILQASAGARKYAGEPFIKFMAENPEKFDAREWLKPAREAAMVICRQRYQQFGCEGQAAKIQPLDLKTVAQRYASGALAQTVV
jgi:fructose/tagatose bisphosphate aldolase